ncbi:MAG: HDIG domain-containing metalloprotein [Bacteriovoracaceae bacterium]|nr:HDIG domain-containing protein [Bacteroidota bacterium]
MKSFLTLIRSWSAKDDLAAKWIILSVFVVLVALMFPQGLAVESAYPSGMIWTENDLYAPFAFPIYKDEREYERERQLAAGKVYKVFEENSATAQEYLDSLQRFFVTLQTILDRRKGDEEEIKEALINFPVQFVESEWQTLWFLRNAERQSSGKPPKYSFDKLHRDVLLVVNGLYLEGIVDVRKSQYRDDELIAKRKKTNEQIVPLNRFLDKYELGKSVQQTFIGGFKSENDTVSIAMKIALTFLMPNVIFQRDQTEREIQFAVDLVPRTVGAVSEGERIIAKRERVTEEIKLKLDSMRKAKEERGAGINVYVTFVGKTLRVFAIMWMLAMYIYLFRKKIYHDNAKLIMISSLFLIVSFIAYLTVQNSTDLPLRYLIIIPAVSMIIAIIFDSRVAFYSTVVISLIVAGIRGNDYAIALSSLVAGAFAIYTVRDIKKRTQIFRSIIYVFLGYAITIVALGLERYESLSVLGDQLLVAGFNAILSPILTYGLLIFMERIFSVSTELTLVDLSDLNHPVLKELSHKAPGSFHHSVSVSTMAESAAQAIGANATLARVGGLYHDIGKLINPDSFVENLLGTENRHRTMSPRKSVRVIAAHIEDGITLARQYKLPQTVIDFIPMHHGTMHVGFFYEKALRQKKSRSEVNENDFRYPGPKPNSKETAIVMLADGVEASTRAIVEPTVEKIEANIDSLIKLRLLEGELDESNLNLRDLNSIKESFVKILIGIHHSRLRYPESGNETATQSSSTDADSSEQAAHTPKASTEKRLQRTIDSIDRK